MNEILILFYLAGCACVAYAGDQRTVGMGKALAMALVATPLVGALLILAWPSRDAFAYWNRDVIAGKRKLQE